MEDKREYKVGQKWLSPYDNTIEILAINGNMHWTKVSGGTGGCVYFTYNENDMNFYAVKLVKPVRTVWVVSYQYINNHGDSKLQHVTVLYTVEDVRKWKDSNNGSDRSINIYEIKEVEIEDHR